jgi:riboflavin-specific deaminase-like protein
VPGESAPGSPADGAADRAWNLILAARALADELDARGQAEAFTFDEQAGLMPVGPGRRNPVLEWSPAAGWKSCLTAGDYCDPLLDLYLPICGATATRPVTVGHLGQSLDGFIATHSGDSQFVTGPENLLHMHRMRALCDVVLVGAGTIASDDPQLTTRHVAGPDPLRVVFDPARRLGRHYRVFTDEAAPTLYVCGRSRIAAGETHVGAASMVGIDDDEGSERDVVQVMNTLRARHCARVFVEGGGITVSAFLEAGLLDRLQITIAPVLIGSGRPAIRLAPQASLRDCRRPAYRVFRMGGDVLFDCEIGARHPHDEPQGQASLVTRVIP